MADYRDNPYELVYDGAITKNEPGKVNIKPVTYKLNGIDIAANLYLPADYDENSDKLYAGITVAHPNGGTKEQVAGLYAQKQGHRLSRWPQFYIFSIRLSCMGKRVFGSFKK